MQHQNHRHAFAALVLWTRVIVYGKSCTGQPVHGLVAMLIASACKSLHCPTSYVHADLPSLPIQPQGKSDQDSQPDSPSNKGSGPPPNDMDDLTARFEALKKR